MKKYFLISWLSVICLSLNAQNNVLNFNGSTSYATLPSSVQPSGTAFSAESWIYIENGAGNDQKILMNLTWGGGCKGFALNIYKDAILGHFFNASMYISGNGYFSGNSAYLLNNTWYHVAMTWSQSGGMKTYLNGVLCSSVTTDNRAYTSSGVTTYMGCGDAPSWGFFKGKLDEVRLWNIELTQADITARMYHTLAGTETGLKAYYQMTNGSGNSLTDNSGGGYTASLNNITWEVASALPVTLRNFSGQARSDKVNLQWNASNAADCWEYIVERSSDGRNYSVIGKIAGNHADDYNYAFTDNQPLKGNNYYRLYIISTSGKETYSSIITLQFGSGKKELILLTNPVYNNQLDIQLAERKTVSVYTLSGLPFIRKDCPAGFNRIDVSALPAGQYILIAGKSKQAVLIQ